MWNKQKQQAGWSLSETLIWTVLLVVIAIFGLKLLPTYQEKTAVENALKAIAADPKLQKSKPDELRAAFAKRSLIENFKSVKPEDIDVVLEKGKPPVLSVEYSVKVPVAGNVFLLVEFKASSENAAAAE